MEEISAADYADLHVRQIRTESQRLCSATSPSELPEPETREQIDLCARRCSICAGQSLRVAVEIKGEHGRMAATTAGRATRKTARNKTELRWRAGDDSGSPPRR